MRKDFKRSHHRLTAKTDKMFLYLMVIQWFFSVFLATHSWVNEKDQIHLDVWIAVLIGSALSSLPLYLGLKHPGQSITRHGIAVAQMLYSSLLIYQTGGRIETHFHVFISLAFLALYRDWKVILTSTIVISLDHFIRGVYFPQNLTSMRWIEHTAWVLFESLFILFAIKHDKVLNNFSSKITLIEKCHEELSKQKEQFEIIINSVPVMLAIFDRNGRFKGANETFKKELGWSPEELIDKDILSEIYPDPIQRQEAVDFITHPKPGIWHEFITKIRSGSLIHTTWSTVRLSTGETIGIGLNITEKKLQEERIHLLQKIDKYLVSGILSAGIDTQIITDILSIVCEHLGWAYGAFWKLDSNSQTLKFETSWSESNFKEFDAVSRSFSLQKGVSLPGNIWKTKTAQWIEDVAQEKTFLRYSLGKKMGLHSAFGIPVAIDDEFVGTLEFFSSRIEKPDENFLKDCNGISVRIGQLLKKANAEVQLTQLLYALDQTAVVTITDVQGVIRYANHNFTKTSGYQQDELIGNKHSIVSSGAHDRAFYKSLWDQILSKRVWKGQVKNRRKSGTLYWESTVIVPYADKNGKVTHFISISTDITAQKKAEEELEYQRAALIQSAKLSSLGEMAGGIAHEINNPLGVIQGKANQLKRQILNEKYDPKIAVNMLEKIEATTVRISKIIHGLRSFARNAEHDPFEVTTIAKILEETLPFCNEKFRNHSIELKVNCPDSIETECRPTQISQVLLNLLHNAFDAVEMNSPKWVTVDVLNTPGDWVEIKITDSGSGIPEEIAEKILLPFFTTKEVGKGTGLGLSISKTILENHGGSLTLDRKSKNTCFIVTLPKRQSQGQEEVA